jgi:uncharacterized small protein (TIGR04563 family)
MPEYLGRVWIDWGWPRLDEREQAVARRHEALLRADEHAITYDYLVDVLRQASQELPGRELRARFENSIHDDGDESAEDEQDDDRAPSPATAGLVARDGRCAPSDGAAFAESGELPGSLTVDDYRSAGVERIAVTLFWREAALNGLLEQAQRLDRSLSWTMQRAWILSKSAPATIYPTVRAQLGEGGLRRQWLYLSLDMFAEVRAIADREERSMSKVVADALMRAWPFLGKLKERD